jgi:FkbM family methyltransferase
MTIRNISLRRQILWFMILGLVVFNAVALFSGSPSLRPLILLSTYCSGRASGCSFSATMNAIDRDINALSAELASRSHVVSTEGDLLLVRTPHGDFWIPSGTALSYLMAEQEFDIYRARDPIKGIRRSDIVLDCGANVGTFVRTALEAGASQVIAIEIFQKNVLALQKTFAEEIADGRVVVVSEGVWHEDASLQLSVFQNSALDSVIMRKRGEAKDTAKLIDVHVTTIDAIISRLGLEQVDFIKMDIEGAERNALRGATGVLRRFRPRLAIAVENLPDDVVQVPMIVGEALPDYKVEAGECRVIAPFLVRPEVLFFFH